MVQKLLTKYGLIFHIACVCILPVFFLGQARTSNLTVLLWLSCVAAEWMLLLPSVRRTETLADARQRTLHAVGWDPLFYIGLAVVVLVGVQGLNSGCELVYLPDADIWQLSKPPLPGAPFSVEKSDAFRQLAVFVAALTVGVTLRNAVSKNAKRLFLQGLSGVSGAFALVCVALALLGRKPCCEWTAGSGASSMGMGSFFGLWLLVGMGLFTEALVRSQRGRVPLFLVGCLGNLLGMLFFASPLMLAVFGVSAIILFFCGLLYVSPLVTKPVQLKFFMSTAACVAAIATGLLFLYPHNPVNEKMKTAWPAEEYWQVLSARNSVRSAAAVTVWQEHPWMGVGAGGFRHVVGLAIQANDWHAVEKDTDCVYNDGLQFLCEYGVLGAGLLLAALITLLIPVCYRARLMWAYHASDKTTPRTFLFRLSPVVVTGILAAMLCCLESFFASPFRSPALLLAWVGVMASVPAFLPEQSRSGVRD